MGVEYNQPAHLLDRYIKGGDINGGRLYSVFLLLLLILQCNGHQDAHSSHSLVVL